MFSKDLELSIFKALGLATAIAALVLTILNKVEAKTVLILLSISAVSYGFYLLNFRKEN